MLIRIDHPELGVQNTNATQQISSGDTTSSVANNDGFSSGDLALFGEYGQERAEVVVLTGTTGNSTLEHTSGPVFDHPVRTPITMIPFDQVEVNRASSQGGSYSVVTTIPLDVDEVETVYDDTAGSTSDWYKIRYYNSQTTTYSDYSDEVQGTGYTESSLRSMVDEVLIDFGDADSAEVSREQVARHLRAGVRNLVRTLIKTYPEYRRAHTTTQLVSGTQTYSLPSRFLAFVRVDVNYTGSSATEAYKAEYISEEDGYPNTTYTTDKPCIFIRGTTFGLRPTPTSSNGYAFIWYWDYPATMVDDADEHGLPVGAREVLVAYSLYRLWMSKDPERAVYYQREYKDQMEEYIEFVGQSPQTMTKKYIGTVFGEDLYDY